MQKILKENLRHRFIVANCSGLLFWKLVNINKVQKYKGDEIRFLKFSPKLCLYFVACVYTFQYPNDIWNACFFHTYNFLLDIRRVLAEIFRVGCFGKRKSLDHVFWKKNYGSLVFLLFLYFISNYLIVWIFVLWDFFFYIVGLLQGRLHLVNEIP